MTKAIVPFLNRLRSLFRRSQLDHSLNDELQFHLEQKIHDLIDQGINPRDARTAALRKFGNVRRVQEETREVWSFVWLERLWQDVRYAMRTLSKIPGFTAVAILTLALGIGANTAVFSLVEAVLIRPIAYPDANRLVWLSNFNEDWGDNMVAPAAYELWKSTSTCFDEMVAYGTIDVALISGGESSQERIASIGSGFWRVTGARAFAGQLFRPGVSDAIVLSWGLFNRRFGGDLDVVGKTVELNGHAFMITGVLPRGFQFEFPQEPTGYERRDIDAYIPLPTETLKYWMFREPELESLEKTVGPTPWAVYVVSKLKPAVTFAQARAQMQTIFDNVKKEHYPPWQADLKLDIAPIKDRLVGDARAGLMIMLGAVCFVLLIACVNTSNLLLGRAVARQREFAIRTAMGAGRARLVRQFVVESLVLATFGGLAGLALARPVLALMIRLGSESIPRIGDSRLNAQVLLFTFAISLITGFLFGLAPALALPELELQSELKGGGGGQTSSGGGLRIREILSTAQLSLTIVLLTGAGLMVKSFWRMTVYPPGFEPQKILSMRISLYGQNYATFLQRDAYLRELLRRIQAVPGVQAAGVHQGTLNTAVRVEGMAPAEPGKEPHAALEGVSVGYLRAMGVSLIRGRWPDEDSFDTCVVNATFVRELLGKADPIGRHMSTAVLKGTIVGVIPDMKVSQLDEESSPEVYVPYQLPPSGPSMTVVVRTKGDATAVTSMIRAVASEVDTSQPISDFQTLENALLDSIAPRSFNMFLLGAFAVVAVALAAVGVHGVIAYSVAHRTHEIGVRLALGAQPKHIVRMVLGKGLKIALIGVGGGLFAALGLTRLMVNLLYGVTATDPVIFLCVTLFLSLVALVACWIPARRAMRVDPMVALRYE